VASDLADGQIEAVRLIKFAGAPPSKRSPAISTLNVVLVLVPHDLRDELESLTDFKLVSTHITLAARAISTVWT
jgi:hypothetical protein